MSSFLKGALVFLLAIFLIPTLFAVPSRIDARKSEIIIGNFSYGGADNHIGEIGFDPLTDYNEWYEDREYTPWEFKIQRINEVVEQKFKPLPDFPELAPLRSIDSLADLGLNVFDLLMYPVRFVSWSAQLIGWVFGDTAAVIQIAKIFLFN